MARLLGPETSQRLVTAPGYGGGFTTFGGRVATVYTDAAATTLASLLAYQSGSPTVPGAAVTGSLVTIANDGRLPLFWFPDNVDTLYATVPGMAGVWEVNATQEGRLDTLAGAQSSYEGTPTGVFRANLRRTECGGNLAALTTQVMTAAALYLEAGDVVTSLTFCSATTAASVPTNWWFALYSTAATPVLLAQTADQTTTAWAANTPKTVALAAPYTVPTSGIYYAAIMVKATTPPTLLGATLNANAAAAVVTGQKVLANTSGSALTTTAPGTIATPTTIATVPYVVAT